MSGSMDGIRLISVQHNNETVQLFTRNNLLSRKYLRECIPRARTLTFMDDGKRTFVEINEDDFIEVAEDVLCYDVVIDEGD